MTRVEAGSSLSLYGISDHGHGFAAWAAGRAAGTVPECRFKVSAGRIALEKAGFDAKLIKEELPDPDKLDAWHHEKRLAVIKAADNHRLSSHGIAAKLINVYLKARFVLGNHNDVKVAALHPPIDRELLKGMDAARFGGRRTWVSLGAPGGWSKLDSDSYQALIDGIRAQLNGAPLWTIEQYWPGHQ